MSNSNFEITNYSVDPVTQQITSLEVNGTPVSSSIDLEDNKAATINVSTYTQPVEVTPTEGKDGMKKATITLSNIPSGSVTLYAYNKNNPEQSGGGGEVDPADMIYATVSNLDEASYILSIDNYPSGDDEKIEAYIKKGSKGTGTFYRWPDYDITL